MKRAIESVANCTRSKRPKLVAGLESKIWVAATHLKNWFGDPIVDFLKLKKSSPTLRPIASPHNTLTTYSPESYLMRKGIEFENKVISHINSSIHPVTAGDPSLSEEAFAKTDTLLKKGVPFIHNVSLKSSNNIGGVADLVVRSDFIHLLSEIPPLNEDEKTLRAPNLQGDYHYLIVDIKFTTLPFCADGKHLLNTGLFKFYKSQVWVYSQAIGEIQGMIPSKAFILGRRAKTKNKTFYNGFNRLGVVNFTDKDSHVKENTKEAVKWIRRVKKNHSKMSVNPPSEPELYPNMCVDAGSFNEEKKRLALENDEITLVWNCGPKQRTTALQAGVCKWSDTRCTAELMGINGKRKKTIDSILEINRSTDKVVSPALISYNKFDWRDKNVLYVDFETIPDIQFNEDTFPNQPPGNMVFMVGVGYMENDSWRYHSFFANSLNSQGEIQMMNEFTQFVLDRKNPNLIHWNAEERFWRNYLLRNKIVHRQELVWRDLSSVLRDEPFVVKGAFKFGLKDIAGAMYNLGLIQTKLNCSIESGLIASIAGLEIYREDSNLKETYKRNLTAYNEFDVKVLQEIHHYLIENH